MSSPQPPRLFVRFFEWYAREELKEYILGDLEEAYDDNVRDYGRFFANRQFIWTVIRFFRPSIIKPLNPQQQMNYIGMPSHYFKSGSRNLLKHKTSSLFNILGLTIGIASCLVILQYVAFESSYDQFHSRKHDIYRVDKEDFRDSVLINRYQGSGYAMGPTILEELPGVEAMVRTHGFDDASVVTYRDNVSGKTRQFIEDEEKLHFVDQQFFDFFDYKVLRGDRNALLVEPNSIVITEAMWQKYMPDVKEPIGALLEVSGGRIPGTFQVSGVIETLPENTLFSFGFLMPMIDLLQAEQYTEDDGWGWTNFTTYILASPEASVQVMGEQARNMLMDRREDELDIHSYVALTPLNDLHLKDPTAKGMVTAETLSLFTTIAVFIIFIAWLNYINLTTAQTLRRAREVGVRKAIGATRGQLILQFLAEAALVNFVALLLGVALAVIAMPVLAQVIEKSFEFGFAIQSQHWLLFLVGFLVGTLLSGLYPALVLSRIGLSAATRGTSVAVRKKFGLRQVLVTAQLMIGLVLISATYSVHRQLQFMLSQDLGLEVEQVLSITSPMVYEDRDKMDQTMRVFQDKLKSLAAVSHVSFSDAIPGGSYNWTTNMYREGDEAEERKGVRMMFVDDQFMETYQMELLAGRFHSKELTSEEHWVVVNETLVKEFGLGTVEEAIGKRVKSGGNTAFPIIGVLKDYHWKGLQVEKTPMLLYFNESGAVISVRLSGADIPATLTTIEEEYRALFPDNPFKYDFMDDFFARQYRSDRRFGQIFTAFSLIAILVACLGLFGLASFTLYQRTKEISIRKVLGARLMSLLMLLYRDYLTLIGLAAVLVLPLIYFALHRWLEDFAYRIDLSVDLFLLPILLLVFITLMTISYQSLRAARTNPATTLRKE
ncbi:MAG: ABC transporter permease [Bacteroidota bacterium]